MGQHLQAVIAMRWQMMRNRLRRSGRLNLQLTMVALALATLGSLIAFMLVAIWGDWFLEKIQAENVVFVWDALVLLFMMTWISGLITELQRSELISLKNLLHLPVSLRGAFALNYLSSWASLTLLLLSPLMLGLCIASMVQYGIASAWSLVLVISFVAMVTAVTYLLRGWLGRLMENKRTRGTVIALTTIGFILLFQIPYLVNLNGFEIGDNRQIVEIVAKHREAERQLTRNLRDGELNSEEYENQVRLENEIYERELDDAKRIRSAEIREVVRWVHLAVPIGWLPYGADAAIRGRWLTPLACSLGMSSLALVSLVVSYRGSVRASMGYGSMRIARRQIASESVPSKRRLVERSLPGVGETPSAIAVATLRSMLRAPEVKMALLTPLILAIVFGSMLTQGSLQNSPMWTRPWFGVAVINGSLLGMVQLLLNMFGLDRHGFRAYVLMPCSRRDILLGKNLSVLPPALLMATILILVVGVLGQIGIADMVATFGQVVIAYLLYFPIANWTSIMAPVGLATGSMKPTTLTFKIVVFQILATLAIPLASVPAIVSLAIDFIARYFYGFEAWPVYLMLTLIELPIVAIAYLFVLRFQGRTLHQHEQTILDSVSKVGH